jgi:hypothetical protein
MAELVPGLQQAQPPAGPQPAGLPPPQSGAPPVAQPNPVGEERTKEDPDWDKYAAEKARLRAIQADLLRQMEERSKPSPMEFWSSMARGFGDPNNKSFASGAAGFAGNLQASNEAQRGREMEMYKMRAEMAKQQLEDTGSDIVAKQLFNPSGGESFAPVAQAAGISPDQAQQLPPEVKKSMMLQWFSGDRKGAVDTFAKYTLENAKTPDEIKVIERAAAMFPGADANKLKQFFAGNKLIGDPAQMMSQIINIREAIDKERIPKPDGLAMIAILQGRIDAGNPQQPAAPAAPATPVAPVIKPPVPAAIPAAPVTDASIIRNAPANTRSGQIPRGASLEDAAIVLNQSIADPELRRVLLEDYKKGITTSPMSAVQPTILKAADTGEPLNQAERDLRNKQRQEIQTARNKAAEAERNKVYVNFNQASQDRLASADVTTLVTQSPNMFGVFERPDFGSAIGGIVENAVNIGRFNIGMPGIRAAVSKLGARNQQDIDNMQKVAAVAVNSSLSLAAAAKGSVSNFERELFQQASLSTHDTPNVLLYKADLLKARANFYTVMWDDFRGFEKKNPSANFSDYQDTAGKQLLSRYEAQLAKIRDNYTR